MQTAQSILLEAKAQAAANAPDTAGFVNIRIAASAVEDCISAIRVTATPYDLGLVLGLDRNLDLPRVVVTATYERLFDLGVTDALTRHCYANYLKLMWGPDREAEANRILEETQPLLDAAGLNGAFNGKPGFGHHPVFFDP